MYKQKSFTLIELLVVIVIIGILAGVVMISTSSSIDKANIAKVKVFEESVSNNLAANMISAWDADHVTKDTTWTLNDKWGNNNGTFYDGTVTTCSSSACPQIVNDKQMGSVLSFDGVNDYISLGNYTPLYPSPNLSISFWIKPSLNKSETILGKFNRAGGAVKNWTLGSWIYNTGWFAYGIGNGSTANFNGSIYQMTKNNWYYVLINHSGANSIVKFYINGQYIAGEDLILNISPRVTSNSYYIGGDSSGNYFSGMLDDIKIYSADLSSSQIKQNYIAGLNSMLANGNISTQEYNERINVLAYDN